MPKGEPISAAEAKNARPYDLVKEKIDDLYAEAKQWLDGTEIKTEAEAEGVEKLLAMARAHLDEADTERKIEAKPFDDGKAEVQGRYNPIMDRAKLIAKASKDALTPWRDKIAARKRAEAEEVARAAEEADRKAEEAAKNAKGDLGATEIAEGAAEEAKRLTRTASKLNRNIDKGLGLRTRYEVEVSDLKAACVYYYRRDPDKFKGFVKTLAEEDVRGGKREIDGIIITPIKGAF